MFTLQGVGYEIVYSALAQSCTITRTINFLSRTIRLQKSAQFSFFSRTLSEGLQRAL